MEGVVGERGGQLAEHCSLGPSAFGIHFRIHWEFSRSITRQVFITWGMLHGPHFLPSSPVEGEWIRLVVVMSDSNNWA